MLAAFCEVFFRIYFEFILQNGRKNFASGAVVEIHLIKKITYEA